MIYVGTCGYAYKDWVGPFYPGTIRSEEMLSYYAQNFPAVEIDSSYYGVLPERTIAHMDRVTPADFRFSFKVPAPLTHQTESFAGSVSPEAKAFSESVSPLVASGKFACALLQFPNSFRPTDTSRDYIRRLAETLQPLPLVAEFRHCEWQNGDTFALLTELGIGWCNVDMPHFETLLQPSADAIGEVGYIRFHGRNAGQWWSGTNVTRYDYLYNVEELQSWTDRVADVGAQSPLTFAFFNNHARGNSARNARLFTQLLAAKYSPDAVAQREGTPSQERLF